MNINTLLAGFRAKQAAALAEYRELGIAIRRVEREAGLLKPTRKGKSKAVAQPPSLFDGLEIVQDSLPDQGVSEAMPASETVPNCGVPLSTRKAALLAYLRQTGGAKRHAILKETAIPPGSLSALLTQGGREGWLKRRGDGVWVAASEGCPVEGASFHRAV